MNELTQFNEGGSHTSNPLGGVPQGINQNGGLNLVQEGETKFNDYIYSNDLILTKDLAEQLNLPKSFANKSFANITKVIENKFKDREDNISNTTKKGFLDKLSQAQEEVKATRLNEMMKNNASFMEEGLPENLFNLGGYLNMASTGMGFMENMKGNNTVSPINGALQGATAGMTFGPWGAGIGAAIGLGSNLIGGNKAKQQAALNLQNSEITNSKKMLNSFLFGGPLNNIFNLPNIPSLIKSGGTQDYGGNYPSVNVTPGYRRGNDPILKNMNFSSESVLPASENNKKIYDNFTYPPAKEINKFNVNWNDVNKYASTAMMLSPAIANLTQKIDKPEVVNPVLNNNRYNPEFIDVNTNANLTNDMYNSSIRGISETGVGVGAMRNSILASNLNRLKALSDIYTNNRMYNNQQKQLAQEFNNSIDEANIGRTTIANEQNEMNRAVYRNAKRDKRQAIAKNIADVGMYMRNSELLKEAFGYNQWGEYLKKNN